MKTQYYPMKNPILSVLSINSQLEIKTIKVEKRKLISIMNSDGNKKNKT